MGLLVGNHSVNLGFFLACTYIAAVHLSPTQRGTSTPGKPFAACSGRIAEEGEGGMQDCERVARRAGQEEVIGRM